MNNVAVSSDRKTVSIQPGAKWEEVYFKLDAVGLAVPGGRDAGVGAGGLLLGGMCLYGYNGLSLI
jgi:FAD/FMN-containing dehydrogenase